ncbi:hypothetical protein WJX77_001245 [Trebouxia sp. C0004]
MHSLTCTSRYRAGCTSFSAAQLPKRGQYKPCRPGKRASASRAAEQQSTTELRAPVVPEEYAGASQQAYLAGFKGGYAAGVQVTVNVTLDSNKGLKAVEYSGGVQQDSFLRSLLKGLVWRVFSTALTVSIILVVFHDTVQIEQALKIGGLEFVLKFLVYFAHERLWVQIGDNIN